MIPRGRRASTTATIAWALLALHERGNGVWCFAPPVQPSPPRAGYGRTCDATRRTVRGALAAEPPPPVDDGRRAYPQQTPHSGRHFLPSHPSQHPSRFRSALRRLNPFRRDAHRTKRKRFMEGWYYRLTIPELDASFAFIFSIDDPVSGGKKGGTELSLAAAQVMGPGDGYMVQASTDDSRLWAFEGTQALGCTFERRDRSDGDDDDIAATTTALDPSEWRQKTETGFQVLPTRLQGRLVGNDGTAGGWVMEKRGAVSTCDFDMALRPLSGWGDDEGEGGENSERSGQRSTAGWLSGYGVFEPHWQVTMADARASGTVNWNGTAYDFADAPFYAEKNWGGEFPSRWYWTQCNSFVDSKTGKPYERLAVTAGGGTRKIPFGRVEDLGMVGVHYDGEFYEAVPWTGSMEWDVDPWGRWDLRGRCASGPKKFEVELSARCDPASVPGVILRAPTRNDGLAYMCRDSFLAETTLSLWELVYDADAGKHVRKDGPPLIDAAKSSEGAVEVGGGPWWDAWRGESRMRQPMRAMVRLPYAARDVRRKILGR